MSVQRKGEQLLNQKKLKEKLKYILCLYLLFIWCGVRCGKPHHVDDELAKALALALGEVLEDVTVFLVQKLEAHSEVVVLQNGLIVVHEGQLRV